MTPLRKLLSLPDPERFLRDGVTVGSLREKEMAMTPVEAARAMQAARQKLFT